MASLTQWTWVWVNSGSWWWTGRPGVLRSWGHKESDTTEWLNWTKLPKECAWKEINPGHSCHILCKCPNHPVSGHLYSAPPFVCLALPLSPSFPTVLFSPPFGWHIHRFEPSSCLLNKVSPCPLHLAIQSTLSTLSLPKPRPMPASGWDKLNTLRDIWSIKPQEDQRWPPWRISGQADSWPKEPKQVP